MSETPTNPGQLKTRADCARLAAYEWHHKEVDHKQWPGGEDAYVAQRVPALAARLPAPPVEPEKVNPHTAAKVRREG